MEQDFIAQMEALKNMPMGMPNMPMMGNGMMMPGFNPMMGMNGFNPQMQMQNAPNMQMPMNMNMPMMGMPGFNPMQMNGNGMNGNGNGMNGFAFNGPQNANPQFNDAYDRQPVNPNRQRGRKPRAPDYRYL